MIPIEKGARVPCVRAFIASSFVATTGWRHATVVAVREATFGGMATARSIFTAGQVYVETIVFGKYILARQATLLFALVLRPEATMLIASVVAVPS